MLQKDRQQFRVRGEGGGNGDFPGGVHPSQHRYVHYRSAGIAYSCVWRQPDERFPC